MVWSMALRARAEERHGEGLDDDGDLGVGGGVLIVKEAAGDHRARLRTSLYWGETPSSMVSLVTPPPMEMRSWNSSMGELAMMPGTCSRTAAMSSRVM